MDIDSLQKTKNANVAYRRSFMRVFVTEFIVSGPVVVLLGGKILS